jgi:hypothetical protein
MARMHVLTTMKETKKTTTCAPARPRNKRRFGVCVVRIVSAARWSVLRSRCCQHFQMIQWLEPRHESAQGRGAYHDAVSMRWREP